MLNALDILLKLDEMFRERYEGESSIGFMFDTMQGFQELEELQNHQNEEIFSKAK